MAILIVDDDPQLGRLLGIRLKSEGYQTITAPSAEEAFRYLGLAESELQTPVELILLDIFLPDLSGIETCRRIKENPQTADVPIIIVTGSSEEEHLQQAFEAGAVDFIEKPFKGVEVLARIRSALRLKNEIQERRRQALELKKFADQLEQANRKLAEANEKLRLWSFQDALTGLHNRRYFDEFLDKELSRAKRSSASLALIMIDIDHFKAYNDHFGHRAGDECLRKIAAAFALEVHRSHDLVARYGGEEFAVILPETTAEGATAVAEGLRHKVEQLQIEHPASPYGIVTISEGIVAHVPHLQETPESLVEKADVALYRSKQGGRNRITIWD